MPEIGECYSIATAIPKLGKVTNCFLSENSQNIMRRQGFTPGELRYSSFVKTEAFGKSILFFLEYGTWKENTLFRKIN